MGPWPECAPRLSGLGWRRYQLPDSQLGLICERAARILRQVLPNRQRFRAFPGARQRPCLVGPVLGLVVRKTRDIGGSVVFLRGVREILKILITVGLQK